MKKIATILTAAALLVSNGAFAATNNGTNNNMGSGAQMAKDCSYNNFAWGIGLGLLAVVAIVVGVTAGTAAQNPSK